MLPGNEIRHCRVSLSAFSETADSRWGPSQLTESPREFSRAAQLCAIYARYMRYSGGWLFGYMIATRSRAQTTHEKHDTRPVTAVRFASIDVEYELSRRNAAKILTSNQQQTLQGLAGTSFVTRGQGVRKLLKRKKVSRDRM
jgi:hypothetical protein